MKSNRTLRLIISIIVLLLVVFGLAALLLAASQNTAGKTTNFQKTLTSDFRSSVEYANGKIAFTIPEETADWSILVSGRIESEGFGGMSVHYLEDTVWERGKTYSFDVSDGNYTELGLTASHDNEEFFIDLMEYLPEELKIKKSLDPHPYSALFENVFLPYTDGTMDKSLAAFQTMLLKDGYDYLEDEGTFSVADPDAEKSYIYGTLTNENGIVELAEIGYYFAQKDRMVKILLYSENPEFYLHVSHMDIDPGTQAESVDELLAYLYDSFP